MSGRSTILLLSLLISIIIGVDASKSARKLKEKGSLAESNNAFCENLMSAFYVSDNINIMSNASAVARNITERGCLDLCTNNRDPKGRLVFCASVVYDSDQSLCYMYRKSSEPDGDLMRKGEAGKRYFEKFCLAEDVPLDCANKQFVRVDDYILKGYAQATAVFPTMAECVAHCIREKEFECRSAMYFYEEGECITNIESAITRPDDFMKPEDDDKVVFFHNGCIQPGVPTTEIAASEDEEGQGKEEASSNEATEKTPEQTEPTTPATTTIEITSTTTETTTEEPTTTQSPTTTVEISTQPTTSETTTERTTESVPESTTSKVPLIEDPKPIVVEEPKEPIKIAKPLTRNIETRLYGAKQLETAKDGSIQEKSVIVGEPPKESPSFITDPSANSSTSANEIKSGEGLQPPPTENANAPRAHMPILQKSIHEPTKQLQLKPIKTDKGHLDKADNQEDGYFGKWGAWTVCRQPGERRIRRRKCLDLRRCKGALMQVDYCPKDLPEQLNAEQNEEDRNEPDASGPTPPIFTLRYQSLLRPNTPVRSPLPINQAASSSSGAPPSILPPQLPEKELKPLPAGAPGSADDIWSPWLGTCQHFASHQPCKNNETIGFESRECIAKDPKMCKGPSFRYCTLAC